MHRIVKPAVLVCTALAIGADLTLSPDGYIREGNGFVQKGEFEAALRQYQQAEERGTDPGLIAFNKATVYYRSNDFRQAENHYRMALDDAAIDPKRRSRALFNLGDCLVQQSGGTDLPTLRAAIRCYELCLDAASEEPLRRDAQHNLELAKLLWNKLRLTKSNPPPPNEDDQHEKQPPEPKKKPPAKSDTNPTEKQPDQGRKNSEAKADTQPKGKIDDKKHDPKKSVGAAQPAPSRVPVIADNDKLVPLSPADTLRALKFAEERLKKERENGRMNFAVPERPSGRDW